MARLPAAQLLLGRVRRSAVLLVVSHVTACVVFFWAGRQTTPDHVSAAAPTADRVSEAMKAETAEKQECEMTYWSKRQTVEVTGSRGGLENGHYLNVYTKTFDLDLGWYTNKSVLDVGCGPRGSLEWAKDTASLAVCADPLAWDYIKGFNAQSHSMHYVAAPMEAMPFASASFDVVASFNNLDHVSDISAGVREMVRVLKPSGSLLLGVHIHERPTKCEPHATHWNMVEEHLAPLGLRAINRHEWEFPRQASDKTPQGYLPFDHSNKADRGGELIVHLVKN